MSFVTPFNIFVGRLTMQGIITVPLINELSDGEGDFIDDTVAIASWSVATFALWYPVVKSAAVGAAVVSIAETTAVVVGSAVTAVAPVTAGYAIGAVTGTVIANEIWGEEGAQVAMGFYSGGLLPGTEAPDLSDYQYILKPTAPGGPESLYDIGKKTFDGLKSTGKALWLKSRPRKRRRFNIFNR